MKSLSDARPWGSFIRFLSDDTQETVKLLYINKGESLSLQYHHKREEFWRVVSGEPEITVGEKVISGKEGDEFNIPIECPHRISAPNGNVIILEISTGDFDESDITRMEDKYNR